MTALQGKQIYIHFELADLTKITNIKLDYKDKTDWNFNFSYNTGDDRVFKRRNITDIMKSGLKALSLCQKLYIPQIGTEDWKNDEKWKVVI